MCRKMQKWQIIGISALVLVVGASVAAIHTVSHAQYDAAACVTVNGITITNEEIDLAYNQQKDGLTPVSREQVIEATVRNTVVRDYGRQNGIAVTETEMDDLIENYHTTGYYDSAVALYGEDGLRQGLYNHELFVRTRDWILADKVTVPEVTEADIRAFLADNHLDTMVLTDKQREDVIYTLTKSKREEAYNAFVDDLLANATIL